MTQEPIGALDKGASLSAPPRAVQRAGHSRGETEQVVSEEQSRLTTEMSWLLLLPRPTPRDLVKVVEEVAITRNATPSWISLPQAVDSKDAPLADL